MREMDDERMYRRALNALEGDGIPLEIAVRLSDFKLSCVPNFGKKALRVFRSKHPKPEAPIDSRLGTTEVVVMDIDVAQKLQNMIFALIAVHHPEYYKPEQVEEAKAMMPHGPVVFASEVSKLLQYRKPAWKLGEIE